jgi:hypothetical membrane protein
MKILLRNLGFFIIIIYTLLYLFCLSKYSDFYELSEPAISDFGVFPKTKIAFQLVLSLIALMSIVFHYYLFRIIKTPPTIRTMSYISLSSLFALANVPYDKSLTIHWIFSSMFFLFYSLFILFFAYFGRKNHKRLYYLGLGITFLIIFFGSLIMIFERNLALTETVVVFFFLTWILILNLRLKNFFS